MAGKKDIVEQALKLIMGAGEEAVPKAIRAYHVSPHDFDVFKPSEFRGSTFFSSTPERARRGAEAGRNEMVMETSTELPPVNWRTYEVEIDPSRIKGLSLTPSENKWFEALPGKIVGDDALKEATKGIPQGMYWDDFYDGTPISEGVYEYTKKSSPPSMSYEEAINKNRDIYRQQWPHYAGTATDEKSSASRLNDQGMGGYLLQDEGGLSFAINDPNSVRIIKKYADGGSIREGYSGKGRVVGDVVEQALKLVTGGSEEAAKTGIRAYHGSPHDFPPVRHIEMPDGTQLYQNMLENPNTPEGAKILQEYPLGRFDMSKIGTGEGAQSYGHGLYLAEREGVAKDYRKNLAYKNLRDKFLGELPQDADFSEIEDLMSQGYFSPDQTRFLTELKNNDWLGFDYPSQAISAASRGKISNYDPSPELEEAANKLGHMYEVNIAADPNTFLDWDKPLGDQSEAVKKFFPSVEEAKILDAELDKLSSEVLANPNNKEIEAAWEAAYRNPKYRMARVVLNQENPKLSEKFASGQQIYNAIAANPREASSLLREAGIPGIRYLDAGSRVPSAMAKKELAGWQAQLPIAEKELADAVARGDSWLVARKQDEVQRVKNGIAAASREAEGTRNYVVFDDKLISIIRKYGIAGASAMLGYNLMENLDANQAQAATVADKEYQATQPKVRGGMLPPGMEPSGEMTSRIPSASERIYDYVRSVLGGDEATKSQRAETVMNIIDQTPLAVGPIAYDIGRGVTEAVMRADGGSVGESYDPDAEAAVALAKREVQGLFPPSSPQPEFPSDGTYVERRPSKIERTFDILSPYVTEPLMAGKRIMSTPPYILMGYGTPEETEAAIGDALTVVSTMGGASSVVPKPANSIGVFGGIKSRTANKNALTKAQIMESQGATSGDIWRETGWERGAEGQWRYEIPDIGSTVDPSKMQIDLSSTSMTTPKTAKLYDYLNHPEFFAAYPEMKNMEVRLQPGTVLGNDYVGYYMPRQDNAGFIVEPHIGLNSNELKDLDAQRSTLLHEIQHAIQQKEGFMRGANKEMFSPNTVPNPKVKIYEDAIRNDAELKEYTSMLKSKEFQKETDEAHEIYMRDVAPVLQELRDKEAKYGVDLGDEWREIFRNHDAKIKEIFPLLKRRDDLFQSLEDRGIPLVRPRSEYLTPGQAYEMTAGEVEARNVQKRRDIERDVLRGKPPETTESFPRNQQLIDWNDTSWRKGYADGGEVDDDIIDALRIAKQEGGVLMEDAKGNKYDAQGNLIPPTAPGPNPARTDAPQAVAQRAVADPATYDALMEYYAVPDRDIADYEATKAAVAAQPYETQQMTHVGAKPRREVTVDMPLFGGEYSMGTAPYDVASGMSGVAQTAYDMKTAPFYAIPFTAPIAAGMDVAEGLATNDPLTASLAIGFGPGSKYAKAAGIGAVNYFMDPADAEAGPARWFSKAVEAARNIPMNKMTGEQALAMLRKGVSPEELKWIGADRFLPGEESITKQGLIDYLEKNRVGTKDVVLGGNKPTRRADVEPTPTASAPYEEEWNRIKAESLGQIERARQAREMGDLAKSDAIKAAWITNQSRLQDLREKMIDATIEEMGGLGEPVRYGPGSSYGEKYMTRGGQDYRETLITLPTSEYGKLYQSGHWEGIPNVVGHIRTQVLDVTPPGSNRPYKAFNVDEAQSDYAKDVRNVGFKDPNFKAKYNEWLSKINKIDEERKLINEERKAIYRRFGNEYVPEWEINELLGDKVDRDYALKLERSRLMSEEPQQKGLEEAPYVSSTQNWTDLSIKKALDQALDAGADYFTYTPGEVQSARYSLRNVVDEIQYVPSENRLYGRKDGRWIFDEKIAPDKLPKYVGSAVADELLKQPMKTSKWYSTPRHVLSGQQLELGGEGMIDYYNNIYKKRVEKVVKDATGKKVQWEVIPVQTADGPREQLGFRLTDDFQNARFSDFNKGGRVTGRGKYADSDAVGRALALTSEV